MRRPPPFPMRMRRTQSEDQDSVVAIVRSGAGATFFAERLTAFLHIGKQRACSCIRSIRAGPVEDQAAQ